MKGHPETALKTPQTPVGTPEPDAFGSQGGITTRGDMQPSEAPLLLSVQPARGSPAPRGMWFVWLSVAAVASLGCGFGVGFAVGAAAEASSRDCDILPECKAGVAVYVDEIDGDQKQITISKDGDKKDWYLTIEPYNSTEVWIVTTTIDDKTCVANVDFNVTGKPNPPPVNLTMTIHTLALRHPCTTNLAAIFTDPTGYLNPIGIPGSADFPLNTWIQIPASLD